MQMDEKADAMGPGIAPAHIAYAPLLEAELVSIVGRIEAEIAQHQMVSPASAWRLHKLRQETEQLFGRQQVSWPAVETT